MMMPTSAPLRHLRCKLRTGVDLKYVEALPAGTAPRETLLLVHGFPDTWFGWRKLIGPLCAAGYRVLAPDMRGYGETTPVRREAEWYAMEHICADLVALLDALLLEKVVIVGHDWGGTAVFNFAMHYGERIKGVASFCTPFFPYKDSNPWKKMQANPGRFDYQMYFQTEAAEKEFEANYRRTVRCMIRGYSTAGLGGPADSFKSAWLPTKDGGAMVKFPADVARSSLMTQAEEDYYVWQFSQTGFFGILAWYRNVEANWRWNAKTQGRKLQAPALMVTAEHDATLPPSMVKHMVGWLEHLDIRNIGASGHWVLQEQPEASARVLLEWLDANFDPPAVPAPRL